MLPRFISRAPPAERKSSLLDRPAVDIPLRRSPNFRPPGHAHPAIQSAFPIRAPQVRCRSCAVMKYAPSPERSLLLPAPRSSAFSNARRPQKKSRYWLVNEPQRTQLPNLPDHPAMVETEIETGSKFLRTENAPTAIAPQIRVLRASTLAVQQLIEKVRVARSFFDACSSKFSSLASTAFNPSVSNAVCNRSIGCSSPPPLPSARMLPTSASLLLARSAVGESGSCLPLFALPAGSPDERRKCQHAVFPLRFAVHRNPLAACPDIHFPRNSCTNTSWRQTARVPIPAACQSTYASRALCATRHPRRIRRLPRQRLQTELLDIPRHQHLFMRCSCTRWLATPQIHSRSCAFRSLRLSGSRPCKPHRKFRRTYFTPASTFLSSVRIRPAQPAA